MPTTATKQIGETKPSQPQVVDEFMKKLKHPLKDVAETVREMILSADKSVGEEIFWNAPSFYYSGKMKPFKPKEYKRLIVGFNFFRKDCIRLIFLRGELAKDKSGLLQGDYTDGRRLAHIHSLDEAKKAKKDLQNIIRTLVKLIDKK